MRVLLFFFAAIVATAVGGISLILYGETAAPLDARAENPLLMAPTSLPDSDLRPGALSPVASCVRPPEAAPEPFGIRPDPSSLKIELTTLTSTSVELAITNQSSGPVTFVSPLDGSSHGLVEPAYDIEAYDDDGRRIALRPRTEPFYAHIYSRTTETLQPGQTFRAQVSLSHLLRPPARLSVHYSFFSNRISAKRDIYGKLRVDHTSPQMTEKLATMFNGRLSSPMVKLAR